MTPSALAVVLVNGLLALVGWATGSMTASGALVGAGYGLAIGLPLGLPGYALLAWFVVLGSGFSRLPGRARPPHEARTWIHATANLGVAALCALAGWRLAFVGALAGALADTSESELGVLAGGRTWLPATGRAVPPGTEGAVSLAGTLAGLLAALSATGLAACLGLLPARLVLPLALGALGATLVESVLGAARPLPNAVLNTLVTTLGALCGALLAAGMV